MTTTSAPAVHPNSDSGTIVVGYDASPSSLAAVRRAVTLAHSLDDDVRVIMTWTYPVSFPVGYPITYYPDQDVARELDALTAELFPTGAPAWFSTAAVQGNAAQVLIAESQDAAMLVVGSRGHGGFAGLLLGSVSSACAAHAACPVLVMRAHESHSTELTGMPHAPAPANKPSV
jgi:nucleotide-binding universal stress UspA family protein